MRSGWGSGEVFENQTQVVFDVGQYRTKHSDLDALSFHLYSRGVALLPDAGLYTYEEGPWKSYFHGTSSHNTVVVDGLDQDSAWRKPSKGEVISELPKKVFPGIFYEDDDVVYQSAQHYLYEGVTHQRAIALIEDNLMLVVDNLISEDEHTYEQKFLLFPEAEIDIDGLTVVARGERPDQSITIRQLMVDGIDLNVAKRVTSPVNGYCSKQYEVAVPCYALSYVKNASTTSFITLLEIGEQGTESTSIWGIKMPPFWPFNKETHTAIVATVEEGSNVVILKTGRGEYRFTYDLSADFDLPNLEAE